MFGILEFKFKSIIINYGFKNKFKILVVVCGLIHLKRKKKKEIQNQYLPIQLWLIM